MFEINRPITLISTKYFTCSIFMYRQWKLSSERPHLTNWHSTNSLFLCALWEWHVTVFLTASSSRGRHLVGVDEKLEKILSCLEFWNYRYMSLKTITTTYSILLKSTYKTSCYQWHAYNVGKNRAATSQFCKDLNLKSFLNSKWYNSNSISK